jgi:hypothetical protein
MNFYEKQYKKYYPVPTVHESIYEYQNVNKDMNLRYDVTIFFIKEIKEWITNYPEFEKLKSKKISYDSVYNILRKTVKKSNLNWYELRSNSSQFKKIFLKHL